MKLLTSAETAKRWKVSRARVLTLCREGRVSGAMKIGTVWVIPADAKNPAGKVGKPKKTDA